MALSETIGVRLGEKQKESLRARAEKRGVSISTYVRERLKVSFKCEACNREEDTRKITNGFLFSR